MASMCHLKCVCPYGVHVSPKMCGVLRRATLITELLDIILILRRAILWYVCKDTPSLWNAKNANKKLLDYFLCFLQYV